MAAAGLATKALTNLVTVAERNVVRVYEGADDAGGPASRKKRQEKTPTRRLRLFPISR
jgi:hypothetical protein